MKNGFWYELCIDKNQQMVAVKRKGNVVIGVHCFRDGETVKLDCLPGLLYDVGTARVEFLGQLK